MPEKDFYRPADADALRRENELLAFEVRFLKSRLSETETASEANRQRLESAQRELVQLGDGVSITPRRKARLESAERELTTLLTRLSKSPLGKVLRLKESYRNLEQRYLKPR